MANELLKLKELSQKINTPFVRFNHYKIPANVINLIPETTARNYKIIPIAKIGPVLTVAMVDPLDISSLDELKYLSGFDISPVLAIPSEILETLNIYYEAVEVSEQDMGGINAAENLQIEEGGSGQEITDTHIFAEISDKEVVVNRVNSLLLEALNLGGSDIHIEPYEKEVRLRYRIDGTMREADILSKDIQEGVIARIKIMSKLDITQRMFPQDGRFSVNINRRDIDFRVSCLPTNFGEKIVLRILDKGAVSLNLSDLGFSPYASEIYNKALSLPFGMILVTGPTGSGKSTTLYSMLNTLNTMEKNLVTIEDPVEYHLRGITQIQIKPEIGLNFVQCLRAVLRQSPDIIMVGEIRDYETADIAMKAALTGHLVLSTLHTNDAPLTITRLLDIGLEPFLIAATLIMISAQRLCRKLCLSCSESYRPSQESLKELPFSLNQEDVILHKAKGCALCGNTGYHGRTVIAETFLLDANIKEIIMKHGSAEEIKKYACSQGMKTLREDGWEKAVSGITSLEEVLRVTAEF